MKRLWWTLAATSALWTLTYAQWLTRSEPTPHFPNNHSNQPSQF